jgi:adenylate cyclase
MKAALPEYTEGIEIVGMFDLAGLTNIQARITPLDLVNILQRYLDTVFKHIKSSGGTVQHLGGNAVVGFWPADSSPQVKARLGVAISDAVESIGALTLPGGIRCNPAIGLACGSVIHARLALGGELSPTAMGPTVNLAMRLSSACIQMKRRILFTASVPISWPAEVTTEELEPIIVKGSPEQLRLVTLKDGEANQSTDPTLASGTPPAGQESRHP